MPAHTSDATPLSASVYGRPLAGALLDVCVGGGSGGNGRGGALIFAKSNKSSALWKRAVSVIVATGIPPATPGGALL